MHTIRLTAVAIAGSACLASASDSSSLQIPFTNLGMDTNATATLNAQFGSRSCALSIKAAGLTPGESYTFKVWEVERFTATADAKGRWQVTFRTPANKSTPLLDFDPRAQVVSLRQGTNVVLETVVSRPGETLGSKLSEKIELHPLAGSGLATLSFQELKNGRRLFSIKLSKVTGTNWTCYVNGINRGNIFARKGQGSALFDSAPGKFPLRALDFDPRGQVVDIAQDTNLVFSGVCEAQIKRVNVAIPALGTATLPSTGLDADAVANAKLRVDAKARRKFSVELENLPDGIYQFLANSLTQGNITVSSASGHSHGEIEFTGQDDDAAELPLTFEPTNSIFTVQNGGGIYFQGALVFSAGGSNGLPVTIDESLASTGLDPDASGNAKFEIDDLGRRKFSVEAENIPLGSYNLFVAGIKRGAFAAKLSSGKVKGELEFSTSPDIGELPLTFDPRGQLLEITNASGLFFANLFGLGGSNGAYSVPLRFKLPLFNLGVDSNATAVVEFKRDEKNQRSFEAEIEDVPAGDYALVVGGVSRAAVAVVADDLGGTRGQVEFSDEAEAGKLPLDFDPLGQLVEVTGNGSTYFGRVLPDGN